MHVYVLMCVYVCAYVQVYVCACVRAYMHRQLGQWGLVSTAEVVHPAVTSMGTWCKLEKQMPNCPCLA